MYTKFLSEQMQSIEEKTDADAAAEAAAKGAGPAAKKARKGSAAAGRAAGAGGALRGKASSISPTQVGLVRGCA
jgi:hypothetical protein